MRKLLQIQIFFSELTCQSVNGALSSRKCSIKALATGRPSIYVLLKSFSSNEVNDIWNLNLYILNDGLKSKSILAREEKMCIKRYILGYNCKCKSDYILFSIISENIFCTVPKLFSLNKYYLHTLQFLINIYICLLFFANLAHPICRIKVYTFLS